MTFDDYWHWSGLRSGAIEPEEVARHAWDAAHRWPRESEAAPEVLIEIHTIVRKVTYPSGAVKIESHHRTD